MEHKYYSFKVLILFEFSTILINAISGSKIWILLKSPVLHNNYDSYITIFLFPFRSLDQCATGVSQPTEQCSEQTTKYTDFERRKLKLFPVLSRYLFVVGKGSVTFHEAKKQQTTTVVYRSDFSTKLIDSLDSDLIFGSGCVLVCKTE